MNINHKNEVIYDKEREKYAPQDTSVNDVFRKIKRARTLLFFAPIVHIGACVLFLILLLVDWIIGQKLGFNFTSAQFGLASGYIAVTILINALAFMFSAKTVKTKNSFRVLAISTLILSTLILSGSLIFWSIPVLLFYALITLVIWIFEVYIAILLINIVEALPN